jgi:hypothetical protein
MRLGTFGTKTVDVSGVAVLRWTAEPNNKHARRPPQEMPDSVYPIALIAALTTILVRLVVAWK